MDRSIGTGAGDAPVEPGRNPGLPTRRPGRRFGMGRFRLPSRRTAAMRKALRAALARGDLPEARWLFRRIWASPAARLTDFRWRVDVLDGAGQRGLRARYLRRLQAVAPEHAGHARRIALRFWACRAPAPALALLDAMPERYWTPAVEDLAAICHEEVWRDAVPEAMAAGDHVRAREILRQLCRAGQAQDRDLRLRLEVMERLGRSEAVARYVRRLRYLARRDILGGDPGPRGRHFLRPQLLVRARLLESPARWFGRATGRPLPSTAEDLAPRLWAAQEAELALAVVRTVPAPLRGRRLRDIARRGADHERHGALEEAWAARDYRRARDLLRSLCRHRTPREVDLRRRIEVLDHLGKTHVVARYVRWLEGAGHRGSVAPSAAAIRLCAAGEYRAALGLLPAPANAAEARVALVSHMHRRAIPNAVALMSARPGAALADSP
ncbi:MAG: hypothetical protein ACOCYW_04460, partial [Roseicyclus sp.]